MSSLYLAVARDSIKYSTDADTSYDVGGGDNGVSSREAIDHIKFYSLYFLKRAVSDRSQARDSLLLWRRQDTPRLVCDRVHHIPSTPLDVIRIFRPAKASEQ
jgi:hypothetical protein